MKLPHSNPGILVPSGNGTRPLGKTRSAATPATAAAAAAARRAAKPRALFLLDDWAYDSVYGSEVADELAARVDFVAAPVDAARLAERPEVLREVEFLFGGWGTPPMDGAFLARAPELRAVFYGAGSIKRLVTDAFWRRGITITSGCALNAVPVAEYTVGAIFLSLKHAWRFAMGMARGGRYLPKSGVLPGAFRTTVGLVSLGAIGARVAGMLRATDLRVIAHDPYFPPAAAAALGVQLVPLDEVFKRSHVVSLHTPWLPETEGMITGRHFESMRRGATFINTARGILVREAEMVGVLRRRTDLTAVLDVVFPEPPPPDSPLPALPNVVLTPHIAGAHDEECRRLGRGLLEELDRLLAGRPLRWRITRGQTARMA
ncbi:MAG: hydroxyacid dehydrogenase [Opitutaceae bacterium]|jgi:phosphoglycerate dehydrogenase-like enzyme|nr:hydroxyacid dehydrogenase [Opitutaceae bacterium]